MYGPSPNAIDPNPEVMDGGWEKSAPTLDQLSFKGDTVVDNDVWLGQNVTVMPGIHIGDGAIVGA